MTYCAKCGEKLPEGARVCPKCDTPVPGASASGATAIERKDHLTVGAVGGALILIGGILAIVLNIIPLLSMLFMGQTMRQMMESAAWSRWGMQAWGAIMAFFTIGAIVTIILGIIAIYAFTKVRAGRSRVGGIIAIVAAIIMLVTLNWIPGIVTIAGGVLCYVCCPSEPSIASRSSTR